MIVSLLKVAFMSKKTRGDKYFSNEIAKFIFVFNQSGLAVHLGQDAVFEIFKFAMWVRCSHIDTQD